MQFVSFDFIVVLPLVALITYLIPQKFRYVWLLILSLAFYASLSLVALPVLLTDIVITYFSGLMIGRSVERKKAADDEGAEGKASEKAWPVLAAAIVVEVGLMFLLRNERIFNVIGISFFCRHKWRPTKTSDPQGQKPP